MLTSTSFTTAAGFYPGIAWVDETAETRAADRASIMAERAERDAAIRATSPDGMTAIERTIAKIEAAARRGVIETTKRRARQFIRRPVDLNAIAWNLSQASAIDGLRTVERLIREEPAGSAFPINVPLTNLHAARLAARWARRAERNGRMEELLFGQVA